LAEALILDSEALNSLARASLRGALAHRARAILQVAYEERALVRIPAPVLAEVCRGDARDSAVNLVVNGVFEEHVDAFEPPQFSFETTRDGLEALQFKLESSTCDLEKPHFELVLPHFHIETRQDVDVAPHFFFVRSTFGIESRQIEDEETHFLLELSLFVEECRQFQLELPPFLDAQTRRRPRRDSRRAPRDHRRPETDNKRARMEAIPT
jgi:hypothetical protein